MLWDTRSRSIEMGRIYSRTTTCNELISAKQRELVIELYTETNKTFHEMSQVTGVPVAKIKKMSHSLQRPKRSRPMTDWERTRLLMQW